MDAIRQAALYGVMPVISIPDAALALPLAAALQEGGLPQIEVTLRSDAALKSIAAIKKAYPQMLAGAGTVLSAAQVDEALAAGADFIVTPGFNPSVVDYCLAKKVSVLPGCVTPTEIETGMAHGIDVFKFFPSENLGGVQTIRQLSGPYRSVRFVPTAGITLSNMASYLACDAVAAVGGSFMAPAPLIKAGDFAAITALTRQAVSTALSFTLAHVGINGKDGKESMEAATHLSSLFGLSVKDGSKSTFSGTLVEFSKGTLPGEKGHIGIGTSSIERAMHYLSQKGIAFREDYRHFDAAGKLDAVYLEEEIGGFAIHIVKQQPCV